MKSIKRIIRINFLILLFSFGPNLISGASNSFAVSILGPSSGYTNTSYQFTYDEGSYLLATSWEVTGGTITSSGNTGTKYWVNATFTTTGSKTIKFLVLGRSKGTKTVTIATHLTPGTIGSNKSICYNTSAGTLTNVSSASGGTSGHSYQWQHRYIGSSWSNISGATGTSYAPGSLTTTREYRRRVISGSETKYSNTLRVTVYSNLSGGTISGNQTICYNTSPSTITSTQNATGGTGSYSYQWQYSNNGSSGWTNISGGTGVSYSPPALTTNKWYRRRVISGSCGTRYTSSVKITVKSSVTVGTISGTTQFCISGTVNLSYTGGNGTTASSPWQKKLSGGSWATLVIGGIIQTGSTISESAVNGAMYRKKEANTCEAKYSNTLTISVSPSLIAGAISGNQNACSDSPPATITSTQNASGGTGSYSYQWQYSNNGSTGWTNIAGATGVSYSPPTLTANKWYRRKVTSGICGSKYTTTVKITVSPSLIVGTISGTTQFCISGAVSFSYTGGNGTTASSPWQKKLSGGSWATLVIDGIIQTGSTITEPAVNEAMYRKKESNVGCGTAYSNTLTLTVTPTLAPGATSGNQNACSDSPPATITSTQNASGGTGSYSYQWQYSNNGSTGWTNIAGATGVSYNPPILTADIWYRRGVNSGNCGPLYTTALKITVLPTLIAGTISGTTQFCNSGTVNLSYTGDNGTVVMSPWQKKTIGGNWETVVIDGIIQTGNAIAEPAVDGVIYRKKASNIACADVYSNEMTIEVSEPASGGYISSPISSWGSATGQLQLKNYVATVNKWQQSVDNTTWVDVPGSTGKDLFDYTDVIRTTNYRAEVSSNICGSEFSGTATVEVIQVGFEGYVSGTTIATGTTNNGTLTLNNYDGNVVQWWYSSNGYEWVAIPASTSSNYSFTNITEQRYYRVELEKYGTTGFSEAHVVSWHPEVSFSLASVNYVKEETLKIEETDPDQIDLLGITQKNTVYQYNDGLGRVVQNVVKGVSPTQNDAIAFQQFDNLGRSTKSYLPYTTTGYDFYSAPLTDQQSFFNTYFSGEAAYAERVYDDSPLQRIIEQGSVGNDWQLTNGHTVKYGYRFNTTNEVRQWNSDGTSTGHYAANTLTKSEIINENGNKVYSFSNSQGLILLKQVEESAGVFLSTHYIYDDLGRLKYSIPPKAINNLSALGIYDANHSNVAELIYTYTYDVKGRLVEKKVPGAQPEYIIYNNLDRVVLTQNGNLRAQNKWYFSKVDGQNRLVYRGIYTNTIQITRTAVQQLFDNLDYNSEPYYETEEVNTTYHGYSNRVFPTSGLEVLSLNYYDHYDFDRSGSDDFSYNNAHLANQETQNVVYRGQPTGSKKRVIGTNEWLSSSVFYNNRAQAIQTLTYNHKGGTDLNTQVYDFEGKVLISKLTHTIGGGNLIIQNRFNYDHAGRLMAVYQTINANPEQQVAKYQYNELGQLIHKNLHEKTPGQYVQSVDYAYNIKGWLKSINDPDDIQQSQLFGMELLYNENLGALGQTGAYNGNISAMKWKNNLGGEKTQAYAYTYDATDRLKKANYGAGTAFTQSAQHFALSTINYDENGNITGLQRNTVDETGTAVLMDNLSYTYTGNQIQSVEDSAADANGFDNGSSATTEYTYDLNGNMTTNANKGIASISFNVLNKPDTVNFDDGRKIVNTYDASGIRLTQEVFDSQGTPVTKIDYMRGMMYENDTLQHFVHPEGRVVVHEDGVYEYQYVYTDHLGNVRMLYTSADNTYSFTATMETEVAADEEKLFSYLPETRAVDPDAVSGNEVARLNSAQMIGPSISLPLFPGDTVDMQVNAYHRGGSNYSSPAAITAFIGALAGAFGGVSGGTLAEQTIYNVFDNAVNPAKGGFGLFGTDNDLRPAAYINYILFDKNFIVKQHGFAQISQTPNSTELLSINGITTDEPGYIYIYLSNESNTLNEVYFDDMNVTLKESPVIQNTNYYPFGLQQASSWTRPERKGNRFLFNAGSELNERTSNYETFYRNYDPALGRFTAIDPMAVKYTSSSPYNYAFNNPVSYNDPLGDDPGGFCNVCNVDNRTFNERWLAEKNNTFDGYEDYVRGLGQMVEDANNLTLEEYGAKYGNPYEIVGLREVEHNSWIPDGNGGYQLFLGPVSTEYYLKPQEWSNDQNGGNLYSEIAASFNDTQFDYMGAKGTGAGATFYVHGGYSVYKGGDGKWYVSVAASGTTLNNGRVEFKGGLTMTVDGKVTQQLPLTVQPGAQLKNPDYTHYDYIGGVTMQLPSSGIVQINLNINYHIQFGSKGHRESTMYNKLIPIRTVGLPRN